jgi:hypothetical protein
LTPAPATAMLPAVGEADMDDDQQDYFDEITEDRWPAGWWIAPGVVLAAVMIGLVVWWLL